ncbi:Innexin, partial [Teladorsagia circumcincta]
GHPIECFVPAQFTRAMEQYTENYCWVQNTYWIPFQDLIPHRLDDRERRQIGYYQWVPFVLAVAALMFHIPSSVWRMLSSQSVAHLSLTIVVELHSSAQLIPDDALMYQREHGARKKNVYIFAVVRVGKFYGAYVSTVYVFIKSLHLCNVVLQFLLLNSFLETAEYPLFGAHVLYDLLLGREWRDSGKFPRVTLCDFEIRVLGLITALNLLFWLCALASAHCRQNFVAKHLDMESDQIGRFTDRFLRPDGVFLLQMIASHAGNLTCAKVTEALWLMFLRRSGKPVLDEKVESSERGEWESNDESAQKESLPRRESWHEPPLPPPMPQLPIRSHYV